MKYALSIMLILSLATVACEKGPASTAAEDVPTCEEVVRHSDDLAVAWAGRESKSKGVAMRKIIEKERASDGPDPAVELCEEKLSAQQRRCVMAANTVVEKNECLKN